MIRETAAQNDKFQERLNEQIEKQLKETKRSEAVESSLALFEKIYRGGSPSLQKQKKRQ